MAENNCVETEERVFHTIIREICSEKGIICNKLSYNWILELKRNNQVYHIAGNRFDLNPEAAGNIACDKYATYDVLKSNNVPVIEHKMVFNPTSRSKYIPDNGIWSDIIAYFYANNCKLVVKPNNGCEGQGVSLCNTLKELEIAILKLFKSNGSISICPYYDIDTEYRTFYLKGEVYLIYGKTKPYVLGDGIHTVKELIELENMYLPENSVVSENLKSIDVEYIPQKEEKFYISWKHNLSGGATPSIVTNENLKKKITELVLSAAHATNIDFATIDVIETKQKEMYIMEINSGVCMTKFIDHIDEGKDIAKKIYSKAIDKMFEM